MRLPVRARLTAWYALLLTAILVGLGAFVVLSLRGDFQAAIDTDARRAMREIGRGYELEGPEDFRDVSRTVLPRDGAAQILAVDGRVRHAAGNASEFRPLVPRSWVRSALGNDEEPRTAKLGVDRQDYRVHAAPVVRGGVREVLVVAESLREVDAAVERVLVLLLLAGPAALAATALGGWWLAGRSLRPVERMTRQASQIGIDELDRRVAVPPVDDELGRLARTLNAMLDRLEQGVHEKHRLIADASHELRTPLAVMRAELDVTLRSPELARDAREVLESTREEVDAMSRTVDNLLTLAQVDEGRLELLTEELALEDAVAAAVRPLRPLATAEGVRLEVTGGSGTATADPHRVHQALTNLIENAIKFSPAGTTVRVTAWERDGEAGVTVADEGPGIPAEAQEHLFDRFYRVDRARGRQAGGSGLGLAICREVAAAHGGRVWVRSEEGAGSAFSLALPARAVTDLPTPVAPAG